MAICVASVPAGMVKTVGSCCISGLKKLKLGAYNNCASLFTVPSTYTPPILLPFGPSAGPLPRKLVILPDCRSTDRLCGTQAQYACVVGFWYRDFDVSM